MISVVLRAKNEAHWLGRCLTALTRQSVPDLDVILVDNDSTDNGVAIAELRRLNGLSNDRIRIGQTIKIPSS